MGPAMGQESFTFIKIIHRHQTHTHCLPGHNTNHHIISCNVITSNLYIYIIITLLLNSLLSALLRLDDSDTSWQLIHSSFIKSRRNQQKVQTPNVNILLGSRLGLLNMVVVVVVVSHLMALLVNILGSPGV